MRAPAAKFCFAVILFMRLFKTYVFISHCRLSAATWGDLPERANVLHSVQSLYMYYAASRPVSRPHRTLVSSIGWTVCLVLKYKATAVLG